jgi:hypothetical protein
MGRVRDEARGGHGDVEVTVRRDDVMAAPRPRRLRSVLGRRDVVLVLAAAAIVIAGLYAAAEARHGAREAGATRRALAETRRTRDFANVLALHQTIFAASQATSQTYRAERGRSATAGAKARLVAAVVPLEAIAYLLRRNLTPIPRAAQIWQRYLVCAFYTARAGVGPALDADLPELARFAASRRPAIGARRCSEIVLPGPG